MEIFWSYSGLFSINITKEVEEVCVHNGYFVGRERGETQQREGGQISLT